jgi:hypothetical protein
MRREENEERGKRRERKRKREEKEERGKRGERKMKREENEERGKRRQKVKLFPPLLRLLRSSSSSSS